jgi:hypothetical protein
MAHGSSGGSDRRHFGRIGRLVCGVAVAIGLMAAIPVATPAQQPSPCSGSNSSTRPECPANGQGQTVPTAGNAGLKASCGLNVALVLDESSSIASIMNATDATQRAARAFVAALTGTGSSLMLTSFSVLARRGPFATFTPVTTTTAATFDSWIGTNGNSGSTQGGQAGYNPAATGRGGTNWQQGLLYSGTTTGVHPPLMVFVTDGDPNRYGNPAQGSGAAATPIALNQAVTAANTVKGQGTHIFAVGVGPAATGGVDAASGRRVRAISGNRAFPPLGHGATTADFVLVTNFGDLEKEFRSLISDLCGGTLTISKYILDPSGNLVPNSPDANGFKFETKLSPGNTHEWVTPSLATNDTATGDTARLTTGEQGEDGIARFEWRLNAGVASVDAAVHEVGGPSGFTLVGAQCEVKDPNGGTTQFPPDAIKMGSRDIGTCSFQNRQHAAKLTVVKSLLPPDDPGRWNLHIGDRESLTAPPEALTATLPLGNANISETAQQGTDPAHYNSTVSCIDVANNNQPVGLLENTGTSAVVPLTNQSQDILCTFTNQSNQLGQITVFKNLIPPNDRDRFNLHIGGQSTPQPVGNGGQLSSGPIRFGTYPVTETAANGTDLSHFNISTICINERTGTPVADNATGPDVSVDLSETADNIQCTITNERPGVKVAHLEVVKHLVPHDDAGLFDLFIGGEARAVDVGHDGTTGPLEFELGTHTVTEHGVHGTDLAGFSISTTCIDTAHGDHQVAHNAHGPSVSVDLSSESDNIVCTITNTRTRPPEGGGEVPPPEPAPHLSVVKTMVPHAQTGELAPITITVQSNGPGTAHGVQLHERPPSGMRIVHVADHGTIVNGTAVWHLGTLAPGESRTVHATALVLHSGLHVDTALATALNADPALSSAALRARAAAHRPPPPRPPPPTVTG